MQGITESLLISLFILNLFVSVYVFCRYNNRWLDDYRENLHRFFEELQEFLPEESLVVWNLTMPLGNRIRGGFLVPEVRHRHTSAP